MYSVSIAHSITEWIHLLAEIWKKNQSMELSFPHNSWKMWFPPKHLPYNGIRNWKIISNKLKVCGIQFPKNYWKQYSSGIWWIHSKTEFDWKDTFQKFYRSLFKMWLPWMHQSNPVFPWNLWKMIFHCNLPVADEFTQKLGKEGFRIKDTEGS